MSNTDVDHPDYEQSADDQLHPTVGPGKGRGKDVQEASDAQTREVIDEIRVPDSIEVQERGVPVQQDGSRALLPLMGLPGFGETLGDCGDDLPLFCEDCGHTAIVGRTCKRSRCPRCGAAWVRDRAVNVASRLAAARAMRDASRDSHQRFHHLAFMPPAEWNVERGDPLAKTFQVVRGILEAMGLEGYVFYHPWAGKSDLDQKSQAANDDGGSDDDRGAWKHRLFNGRSWSDVREELQFRPHFHVIAVGHKMPGGQLTSDVYDETGWVLKRITKSPESNVSLYDEMDMCRAVTYCISHTAIDNSGENNRVQYRKYGSALNQAEVYEDNKTEIEKKIRKVAPKTLGVSLSSQLCTTERVKPDGSSDDGPTALSILASSSSGGEEPAALDSGGVLPDTGAGSGELELPGDGNLPDAAGGVSGEQAPPDVEKIDPEPCEGRMLHIKKADRYLEDDEWLEGADHADQLQTAWADWEERLDELVGG
jgi:hypothetical protein